jgi:hypothetical protein
MGIVPKEAHDELIVITKIRNAFAHREDARDFSSPVIVKLCDKLTFSDEEEVTLPDDEIKRMMFERALEIAVKFSPPQGHPSSKFVQSCIWLALMLIAPGEIKRTIERADAEREKSSLEDDAGQSGADGSPE